MFNHVASAIFQQLGGSRFVVMTGARDFAQTDFSLKFRVPLMHGVRANVILITLNQAADLYDVVFYKVRARSCQLVHTSRDLYAEDLRSAFERVTGLATSLGTMGRAR